MTRGIIFALLCLSAAALKVDFSDQEWKTRPVTKVVNLLKDMSTELQKEADSDGEMYDKLACWCQTNDKEKTKAISDAEQRIKALQASAEENTAKSATLEVEIKKLGDAINENTEA